MSVQQNSQLQLLDQTKELLALCKIVESEVIRGKPTVNNLNTLRAKRAKVNKFKLKALYTQALSDAEHQKNSLLKALKKIDQIRQLEHTIRVSLGPRHFRRGVLMSVLQESAKSIPMWVGKPGERAPPLGGAIPATSTDYAKKGDHVAALVPEPDVAATAACNLAEGCILAEVVNYDEEKQTYQVEDVDAEEGKMCYTLPRSKVVPLPKWKANPVMNPEAIFPEGTTVLALYPQTTCFYKAIVDEVPLHVHDEYSLYFEDSSYPEGYAPAIRILQRYVIEFRDNEGGPESSSALSVHPHGGSGRKRSK